MLVVVVGRSQLFPGEIERTSAACSALLSSTHSLPTQPTITRPLTMVVGAAPTVQSKKSIALAKKLAAAPPLPSSKGVDPAATTVEKKVVVRPYSIETSQETGS